MDIVVELGSIYSFGIECYRVPLPIVLLLREDAYNNSSQDISLYPYRLHIIKVY
jgi:hypothetical protein